MSRKLTILIALLSVHVCLMSALGICDFADLDRVVTASIFRHLPPDLVAKMETAADKLLFEVGPGSVGESADLAIDVYRALALSPEVWKPRVQRVIHEVLRKGQEAGLSDPIPGVEGPYLNEPRFSPVTVRGSGDLSRHHLKETSEWVARLRKMRPDTAHRIGLGSYGTALHRAFELAYRSGMEREAQACLYYLLRMGDYSTLGTLAEAGEASRPQMALAKHHLYQYLEGPPGERFLDVNLRQAIDLLSRIRGEQHKEAEVLLHDLAAHLVKPGFQKLLADNPEPARGGIFGRPARDRRIIARRLAIEALRLSGEPAPSLFPHLALDDRPTRLTDAASVKLLQKLVRESLEQDDIDGNVQNLRLALAALGDREGLSRLGDRILNNLQPETGDAGHRLGRALDCYQMAQDTHGTARVVDTWMGIPSFDTSDVEFSILPALFRLGDRHRMDVLRAKAEAARKAAPRSSQKAAWSKIVELTDRARAGNYDPNVWEESPRPPLGNYSHHFPSLLEREAEIRIVLTRTRPPKDHQARQQLLELAAREYADSQPSQGFAHLIEARDSSALVAYGDAYAKNGQAEAALKFYLAAGMVSP